MKKWLNRSPKRVKAAPFSESLPTGADADVWAALPEDLREELWRDAVALKLRESSSSPHKAQASSPLSSSTSTWSAFALHKEEGESALFVDTTFPADASSIDGRVVNAAAAYPNCKCGGRAGKKRVSKDGENQGRLFLGCYKPAADTSRCNFFQWGDNVAHDDRALALVWQRMRSNDGYIFVSKARDGSSGPGFKAADIQQGGLGDCWFLSAISVVAERADLVERVCEQRRELAKDGKYTFRLFFDGDWRDVTVDDHLPVQMPKAQGKGGKRSRAAGAQQLAYSKAKHNQLWIPLLEKAYAKAHGSYEAIVGGWIREALLDLTGQPCECVDFWAPGFDSELCWAKLLSFKELDFPMGAATSQSGEGIVGGHAYSVLEVVEVNAAMLGHQTSLARFTSAATSSSSSSSSSSSLSSSSTSSSAAVTGLVAEGGVLRLLRVRNPWSRKEWTGALSAGSELWTPKLRQLLNRGADMGGTFWMSYNDMLRRFEHIDVCKARKGWSECSAEDRTCPPRSGNVLCRNMFFASLSQRSTEVSALLLQRTKRGKAKTAADRRYWYSSLGLLVFGPYGDDDDGSSSSSSGNSSDTRAWQLISAVFCGSRRDTPPLDLILGAGKYLFVPVCLDAAGTGGSAWRESQPYVLRLCSSAAIALSSVESSVGLERFFGGGGGSHPLHFSLSAMVGWKVQKTVEVVSAGTGVRVRLLAGSQDECFALTVHNGSGTGRHVCVTLETGTFACITSAGTVPQNKERTWGRDKDRDNDSDGHIHDDAPPLVPLRTWVPAHSQQVACFFVYDSCLARRARASGTAGARRACPIDVLAAESFHPLADRTTATGAAAVPTVMDLTAPTDAFDPFPFAGQQ